jgi:hypothetical protein
MSPPSIPASSKYHHTQRGPWGFLLLVLGGLFLGLAWITRHEPPAPIIVGSVAVVLLALAPCFHSLSATDEGDRLAVQFGPLGLFKTNIPYDEIRQVEIGRTWLIEGWGIHLLSTQRGWVWNIWGRDCVVIHHRRIMRLGSDEPEELLAFLESKRPAAVR